MTRFATVNVPAVTSKLPGLAVLINNFDFDIVAIQEADVNFPSRASFRNHCLKLGYHVAFGDVDPRSNAQATRVVLLSKFPMRAVFPNITDPHRLALAAIEIPSTRQTACAEISEQSY